MVLYLADQADDGKVEGKCFTFTLHTGLHTHIFKTRIFNQNYIFKSIELLDGEEKERALTKSREFWGTPVATVCCCISKWRSSDSSFTSCPGLAWDFSYLTLLNLLILD